MTQGKIHISGKDRTKFLQYPSQDINKFTPGTGGHGALKRGTCSLICIYSDEDSFLIEQKQEVDKIIQY
jgi:hypothetical protein